MYGSQDFSLKECEFYHTIDIPGWGAVEGLWDLCGSESTYLGNVPLKGKRVLEIGPASGCLTVFMEREGAEVVSVETGEDHRWEFFWDFAEGLPQDLANKTARHREHMAGIRRGYELYRSAVASRADVRFANAYHLPDSIGQFDIAVMASVLLHNKTPLRIVEECARLARESIVIVEPYDARLGHLPCMSFLPQSNCHAWDTWWAFSPTLFVRVLATMGFTQSRVSFHSQKWKDRSVNYFTVVATKPQQPARAVEPQRLKRGLDLTIKCATQRLRLASNEVTCLYVTLRNASIETLPIRPPNPVQLSYHWRHLSGEIAVWDGERTALPWALGPNEEIGIPMLVRAPSLPGEYSLELAPVQENVTWFGSGSIRLPLRIPSLVV